jgi:hypothetical protein
MAWGALLVLLAVWILFLLFALWTISNGGLRRWSIVRTFLSERIAADRRAAQLLREQLSTVEYQQLMRHGYLEVASPGFPARVYRIPGRGGLVRVLEQGKPVMDLCLQPVEPLPDGDVILMHKLMILGSEQEYLDRANHFAPGIISLRYGGL